MIISNCFHKNRLINNEDYIYTDSYLNYYLEKLIYKLGSASDNDLIINVVKDYDKDCIKLSLLKNRFNELFGEKNKGKYNLSTKIRDKITSFKKIEDKFMDVSKLQYFLINSSLNFDVNSYEMFIDNLILFVVLNVKSGYINENEGIAFLYNFIENINSKLQLLETSIKNIKKIYYKLSLYDLFDFNDVQKNICIKANLNNISDLNSYSIYFILYLFSLNFDENINILAQLKISINDVVEKEFSIIGEKEYNILIKRNGYFSLEKLTLEEIGKELNVTRERIRQIESKQLKKIKKISQNISLIIYSFYYNELGKKHPYIEIDKLKNKYDEKLLIKMLLLFEYGESKFKYDSTYKIIYEKNNNIQDMIDEVINKIGIVAEPKEIDNASQFVMSVVKNNYKEITPNLYLKNGYVYRDLFLDLICELYPRGFHISDENEYEKFISIVKERYNIYKDIPSKHSLEAMISRGNFILIDRGTYLSKKYASVLDDKLLDNMLNYISQNEFTYYNTLFEMYKNELKIGRAHV